MFTWSDEAIARAARAICEEAHLRRHGFHPDPEVVERDLAAHVPLARAAVLALHDPAALEELREVQRAQTAALLGDPLPT